MWQQLPDIGGEIFMNRIQKAFDHQKAFIGFLTAGDPYLDKTIEFVYIDNDKVVSIVVPFIYDEYGDNFMKYDEFLDEIIK